MTDAAMFTKASNAKPLHKATNKQSQATLFKRLVVLPYQQWRKQTETHDLEALEALHDLQSHSSSFFSSFFSSLQIVLQKNSFMHSEHLHEGSDLGLQEEQEQLDLALQAEQEQLVVVVVVQHHEESFSSFLQLSFLSQTRPHFH